MGAKIIIKSKPDTLSEYFLKLRKSFSLCITFAKRDIKVKYSQTLIGIGWTVVQPLAILIIFTFFFGYILKWEADNVPFALYVYTGLLPWNFFTYIVYQGSNSFNEAATLIRKVYFPKLLLPLSKIIVALVELIINIGLLVILLIYYQTTPSWHIIFLPLMVILNIIPALTIVVWSGAISYKYRDILHLIPFMMNIGIWITPVFFTINILPEQWNFLWSINPLTGIVELWRWCLLDGWSFNPANLISTFCLIPLLILGLRLYVKNESKFSDYV